MTDYTKNVDYAAKDGLLPGNPLKVFYGADIDSEWAEIVTAIASKYDSTDLAVTPVGTETDVLVTPESTRTVVRASSALTTRTITAGSGLDGGGDLSADRSFTLTAADARNVDHSLLDLTMGDGLKGTGDLTASRTVALDGNSLTEATPDFSAEDDMLPFYDGAAHKKCASPFRRSGGGKYLVVENNGTWNQSSGSYSYPTSWTTHINTSGMTWNGATSQVTVPHEVRHLAVSCYLKFDGLATAASTTHKTRVKFQATDVGIVDWNTYAQMSHTGKGDQNDSVSYERVIDTEDGPDTIWNFQALQENTNGDIKVGRNMWLFCEVLTEGAI